MNGTYLHKLHPLRSNLEHRPNPAGRSSDIPVPALHQKKGRGETAKAIFLLVGGVSWIIGLFAFFWTAAAIEQAAGLGSVITGAGIGLVCLGITAIASRMEGKA